MPIEYRSGDLFTSDAEVLAHGCNCQGVMGAGIAKEFKDRYPGMFKEYNLACKGRTFEPGSYMVYEATSSKTILNLATQDYPGRNARLDLIEKSLTKALEAHPELKSIAMPRIGCGIGGLAWEEVERVLKRVAKAYPLVTFYVYTL